MANVTAPHQLHPGMGSLTCSLQRPSQEPNSALKQNVMEGTCSRIRSSTISGAPQSARQRSRVILGTELAMSLSLRSQYYSGGDRHYSNREREALEEEESI